MWSLWCPLIQLHFAALHYNPHWLWSFSPMLCLLWHAVITIAHYYAGDAPLPNLVYFHVLSWPNLNSYSKFLHLVWGQTTKLKDQYFWLYSTSKRCICNCIGIGGTLWNVKYEITMVALWTIQTKSTIAWKKGWSGISLSTSSHSSNSMYLSVKLGI